MPKGSCKVRAPAEGHCGLMLQAVGVLVIGNLTFCPPKH